MVDGTPTVVVTGPDAVWGANAGTDRLPDNRTSLLPFVLFVER